jgi:energy-coupling factor transport system ATP-binding protein
LPLLEHTGHKSLSVEAGELISVLGAPGSGKSRLGLELAFLTAPAEGKVLFHGTDPLAERRRFQPLKRPKEITMLVQDAEAQLFARTVFDDVAFGPRHLRLPEPQIEARVQRALISVRLDPQEVRGRSPFALSGGERRRVALAGVLAMEPEVLILDEPTASLDPGTRNQFLDLLTPLRGRSAIIWFTASAREASLASRIYLLLDGDTTEVPGGSALWHRWRDLLAAGIELPAAFELAGALESRGAGTIPGETAEAVEASIAENWKARAHAR